AIAYGFAICDSSRKTLSPPLIEAHKIESAEVSNMPGHFGIQSLSCRLVLIDRPKDDGEAIALPVPDRGDHIRFASS
ncbi:hypothetical protein O4214_17685, partial [Rhodococcus erythropolis]|uniref:hypothetical protein n=1 Tax=Rhodococcus erythropolis TaxID=1833 RepID=UPI001E59037D